MSRLLKVQHGVFQEDLIDPSTGMRMATLGIKTDKRRAQRLADQLALLSDLEVRSSAKGPEIWAWDEEDCEIGIVLAGFPSFEQRLKPLQGLKQILLVVSSGGPKRRQINRDDFVLVRKVGFDWPDQPPSPSEVNWPPTRRELEDLLYDVLVDAHDEYEQIAGFKYAFQDEADLPIPAIYKGKTIDLFGVGSEDTRLLAEIGVGEDLYDVPLRDVFPEPMTPAARLVAAYRMWSGISPWV